MDNEGSRGTTRREGFYRFGIQEGVSPMLKTLGIVQACCGSPRFQAVIGRRIGGKPLLEWVVRRVTEATRLDGVIVVCRDGAEHQCVADLIPPDVPVFRGDEPEALGRLARAVEQYPSEAIVRVRGESPFVDPALIDRLVTTAEAHPASDYMTYCSRDGQPAILSPVGVYAEWFRAKALRKAARAARRAAEREDVTQFVFTHPEKFHLRLIPAPAAIDREDVRLSVDFEEDWDHALAIYDALGPDSLEWQRIADLLDHQPALRQRMATLNRAKEAIGYPRSAIS